MNAPMPGEPRKPEDTDDVAARTVAEYHASMDKRLSILEMRFDTVLPTLATKADLAELRTEILTAQERLRSDFNVAHEKLRGEILNAMRAIQSSLLMWIVSTMVAMFLGMVGLFLSISSTMMETTERMVQTHIRGIQDAREAQPASPRPSPSP